jgi:hypothetical protein
MLSASFPVNRLFWMSLSFVLMLYFLDIFLALDYYLVRGNHHE